MPSVKGIENAGSIGWVQVYTAQNSNTEHSYGKICILFNAALFLLR